MNIYWIRRETDQGDFLAVVIATDKSEAKKAFADYINISHHKLGKLVIEQVGKAKKTYTSYQVFYGKARTTK